MGTYKVWNQHKQRILVRIMKGETYEQIANALGYKNPSGVRKMILDNQEEFDKRRTIMEEKLSDKCRQLLETHVMAAARKLIRLAKEGDPKQKIQFDAVKEILYMCGMKPKDVIEQTTKSYTSEEVDNALKTSKEIEEITNRLTGKKSAFILSESQVASESQENPSPSPVPGSMTTPDEADVTEAKSLEISDKEVSDQLNNILEEEGLEDGNGGDGVCQQEADSTRQETLSE